MEIVDSNGHVSTQTEEVLSCWKADYEHLFCEKSNTNFDDTHLSNIQSAIRDNQYPAHNADRHFLNAKITKSEIEKSILRANLGKASGLDNILAEVLRNPICV